MPFITLPLLNEALNIQSTPYWVDDEFPEDSERGWGTPLGTKWGPMSKETKQLMSKNHTKCWRGKTLSSEHREKIRQTKLAMPDVTCSSCGKTMKKPNFIKYNHTL